MSDKKLTQLTELTTVASDDKLYVVDASDTTNSPQGTGKYVQVTNLASATQTTFPITSGETTDGLTADDIDQSYPPGDEKRYKTLVTGTQGDHDTVLPTAGETTTYTKNYTLLQAMINECQRQGKAVVIQNFYFIASDELLVTQGNMCVDGCDRMGGLEQTTMDVGGPLRFQGDVAGATQIKNCAVRGMRLRGPYNAANGWSKGNEPHTGPNETTDTEASPLEAIYVDGFVVENCEIENSCYDAISMPKDVTNFVIAHNRIYNCQDDGINPGGLPATGGNGVRRGWIHHNYVTYCHNSGIHLSASAVDVNDEDGVTVEYNFVDRCGYNGIDFSSTGYRRHYIRNNVVTNCGKPDPADPDYAAYPGPRSGDTYKFEQVAEAAYGILARGGASTDFAQTEITGNVIINIFDLNDLTVAGIYYGSASDTHNQMRIAGNVIDFTTRDVTTYPANVMRGIVVGDATALDSAYNKIDIHDNHIYGNKDVGSDTGATWGRGLLVAGGDDIRIRNNFITRFGEGVTSGAIQVWANAPVIEGNTVTDCYGTAISVDDVANGVIRNNNIQPSYDSTAVHTGVYVIGSSEGLVIEGNHFEDTHINNTVDSVSILNNNFVFSGSNAVDQPILSASNANCTIAGNDIRITSSGADPANWTNAAILFNGADNKCVNNTIHRVDTTGAEMIGVSITAASDRSIVKGNTIYIEGRAIVVSTESDDMQITDNNCTINTASRSVIEVNVLNSLIANNTLTERGASTTGGIDNNATGGTSLIANNVCEVNGGPAVTSSGADRCVNNTSLGRGIPALDNSGTPSVKGADLWKTGGTTAITDFDDGFEGQVITVISEHAITITDGTNIFLNGSANFVMAASDTLTLVQKADTFWYEVSRSVN